MLITFLNQRTSIQTLYKCQKPRVVTRSEVEATVYEDKQLCTEYPGRGVRDWVDAFSCYTGKFYYYDFIRYVREVVWSGDRTFVVYILNLNHKLFSVSACY